MMQQYIQIKDLTKRYSGSKTLALRGINLSVAKGEFFGLLGPNGSGKTTLISILCGLLRANSGSVSVAGRALPAKLSAVKPLIGLVPQEIALYQTLTVRENLQFFGRLYGLSSRTLKSRIGYCLEITGLTKYANDLVHSYSGGMKRRANLALGLLHSPSIVILDEPTVNVDPQSRQVIFEILKQLNADGTTMIYTTHYLEEAQSLCSRVAIIDQGKVMVSDTPENLVSLYPSCVDLGDVFLQLTGHGLRD